MARQQAVQLKVRPVATDFSTGQMSVHNEVMIEAMPTDTLRDIEIKLIEENIVPPSQEGFKWAVVTASGEEIPVSNTTTVGQIVDMYQPRELKILFDAQKG